MINYEKRLEARRAFFEKLKKDRASGILVRDRLLQYDIGPGNSIDYYEGEDHIYGILGKYNEKNMQYGLKKGTPGITNISVFRLAHLAKIEISDIISR